jgi:hypothetical protein
MFDYDFYNSENYEECHNNTDSYQQAPKKRADITNSSLHLHMIPPPVATIARRRERTFITTTGRHPKKATTTAPTARPSYRHLALPGCDWRTQ